MSYQRVKDLKVQCEWSTCSDVFDDMDEFYKHLEDHFWADIAAVPLQPGSTVVCLWKECNFTTTSGHDLVRHIYFHGFHTKLKWRGYQKHLEANTCECNLAQNRNIIPELPDGFKCCWEDCYAVLDIPDKFYDHIREHAIIAELEDIGNGDKGYKCHWEDCNYVFKHEKNRRMSHSRHKLRLHMSSHTQERSYACPWCGNLYVNLTKLIDHFTRQLSEESHTFQCTHCSRTFASERILKDHMRHHVNHYQCSKCAMTCPNPSALKHHMRYKHSDDRPYACEFCEYRSKEPHDLQIHMQFHQSDLSYQCQVEGCDYIVRSLQNLRYHYRVKHGEGDGRQYACHMCDKKYSTGYQLTPHLRKVHNFQWPPGHCRFRYKECEDGLYRLQIFRYESIELTEQRMSTSRPENDDEVVDPCELAHITPSTSTAPARTTRAKRKVMNETIIKSGTKRRKRPKKQITTPTRKSPRVKASAKVTASNDSSAKEPLHVNRSPTNAEYLPDLYINSDECLEAADTLCNMKTNSNRKRKLRGSREVYSEEIEINMDELFNNNDGDIANFAPSPERNMHMMNVGVTTRSGGFRKSPLTPSQYKSKFNKVKKRLKLSAAEKYHPQSSKSPLKDPNKENINLGNLKECSVELVPVTISCPVFPDHHKIYLDQLSICESESHDNVVYAVPQIATNSSSDHNANTGLDLSTLFELDSNTILVTSDCDVIQDQNPNEFHISEKVVTAVPSSSNDQPPYQESSSNLQVLETVHASCGLGQAEVADAPLPITGETRLSNDSQPVMQTTTTLEDERMVEINGSEMVLDEQGNRTVVNVNGEDHYIVAGTDAHTGGTAYGLVKVSDYEEDDE